jgi:hypothetical protein
VLRPLSATIPATAIGKAVTKSIASTATAIQRAAPLTKQSFRDRVLRTGKRLGTHVRAGLGGLSWRRLVPHLVRLAFTGGADGIIRSVPDINAVTMHII